MLLPDNCKSVLRNVTIIPKDVCAFVVLCGYNRMHMTNHFLSDVCFGTLNTCLLTAGICTVFLKAAPRKE